MEAASARTRRGRHLSLPFPEQLLLLGQHRAPSARRQPVAGKERCRRYAAAAPIRQLHLCRLEGSALATAASQKDEPPAFVGEDECLGQLIDGCRPLGPRLRHLLAQLDEGEGRSGRHPETDAMTILFLMEWLDSTTALSVAGPIALAVGVFVVSLSPSLHPLLSLPPYPWPSPLCLCARDVSHGRPRGAHGAGTPAQRRRSPPP